ncbi:unnamed protein product [Arctia plantaginis]|uniref:Uncharacterized protein n=1 Tax=Arctia plantaginis TaxID=874455 RepID=A0A8S1A3T6_ARCPL|nr:unnamed protein product [Arctia plantaginis]
MAIVGTSDCFISLVQSYPKRYLDSHKFSNMIALVQSVNRSIAHGGGASLAPVVHLICACAAARHLSSRAATDLSNESISWINRRRRLSPLAAC